MRDNLKELEYKALFNELPFIKDLVFSFDEICSYVITYTYRDDEKQISVIGNLIKESILSPKENIISLTTYTTNTVITIKKNNQEENYLLV